MPSQRQLQFRVGLFVLVAMCISVAMVFRFGEILSYWDRSYPLTLHFEEGAGLHPSTPIFISGIEIGFVQDVALDHQRGGVRVVAAIREEYPLRADSRPHLSRTLLGDTSIEFAQGTAREAMKPGSVVEGYVPADPLSSAANLASNVSETLDILNATAREWQRVGGNLNHLLATKESDLDQVIANSIESLNQFATTMQTANRVLESAVTVFGDPEQQRAMQLAFAQMPEVIRETQKTIVATRRAVENGNQNLENLTDVTGNMAKHSDSILIKLDKSLGQMEMLVGELNLFARMLSRKDGSVQRLIADPALYENLNRSAGSLAMLLKSLEQSSKDLSIFSDKIARYPELIGLSGALNGSTGLKDALEEQPLPRVASPPQRSRQ